MATRSGFFNSVNGDRRYLAGNFAEYFATFIGNGVFPNPSSGLQVVANNNLSINVKAGKGWINGYYFVNDSDAPFTLDVADGVLKRIDRIVFRLNFSTRAIAFGLKKGTFSASPVAPTLQRDADIYELALADIYIGNGVTAISQANITDQRMNSALCGIVQGTVNQVDTTTIYNQYEAWFNETRTSANQAQQIQLANQEQEFREWFNGVMGILDGDTAGNLANEIMRVEAKLDEHIIDYIKHPATATATFSANQYTVNIDVSPTILMEGMGVVFLARNASTGAATLKINTRTAYPILRPNGLPLTNIRANSYYAVRYSLVTRSFMLLGEGGEYGEATPSTVKRGVTFGTEDGLQTGTLPYLDSRFNGKTFYRNKIHDLVFNTGPSVATITKNNKYLIGAVGSNIYRYDIEADSYMNLGSNGFSDGILGVFANDEGTKVFVTVGNTLSMHNGTSWSRISNSSFAGSQTGCTNADGSEAYFINSGGQIAKINTSTNVVTVLTTDSLTTNKLIYSEDNCLWYHRNNILRKISTVDGSLVKSVAYNYSTLNNFSANSNPDEDIELVTIGRSTSTDPYFVQSHTKAGVATQIFEIQNANFRFANSVDGKRVLATQTTLGDGTRVFAIGNEVSIQHSLGYNIEFPNVVQVSPNGYYANAAETFTTIVTYK